MGEFGIEDHPDLQSRLDGPEDIQTLELMANACRLNELLLGGAFRSEEDKQLTIDLLNRRYEGYIGQPVIVSGDIVAEYEGELVVIHDDVRTSGYFQGFRVERLVGQDAPVERLVYQCSSVATTGTDPDEIPFIADMSAYLEFPDLISKRRLLALAEPHIAELDAIILDESVDSVASALMALKDADYSLQFDSGDAVSAFVAEYVAHHISEVIGMDDVQALKLDVDGLSISRSTGEYSLVNGSATLVRPSIYLHESFPETLEVCLAGTFVQSNTHGIPEERIILLSGVSSISIVGE